MHTNRASSGYKCSHWRNPSWCITEIDVGQAEAVFFFSFSPCFFILPTFPIFFLPRFTLYLLFFSFSFFTTYPHWYSLQKHQREWRKSREKGCRQGAAERQGCDAMDGSCRPPSPYPRLVFSVMKWCGYKVKWGALGHLRKRIRVGGEKETYFYFFLPFSFPFFFLVIKMPEKKDSQFWFFFCFLSLTLCET